MSRSEELTQQLVDALKEDADAVRVEIEELDVEIDQLKLQRGEKVSVLNDIVSRLKVLGHSTAAAPTEGGFACAHCPRSFPTRQGRSMHTTKSHADQALRVRGAEGKNTVHAVPAPPDPMPHLGETTEPLVGRPMQNPDDDPDPTPIEVADDVRAIRCDDCTKPFANPKQLHNHVYRQHGRDMLSRMERMPRTLAQVA